MSDNLRINQNVTIPAAELDFQASRSGGPGGQHANTSSTRVTLAWDIANSAVLNATQRERLLENLSNRTTNEGVLQIHAGDERSQHRNRQLARERLAEVVRKGLRVPRRRKKTKPTRASQRRRLERKRRRGRKKQLRGRVRRWDD